MARYELMDLSSGNFAGIYETAEDALRDVAAHVARFGEATAHDLALGYNDYPSSDGYTIAEGPALVALALRGTLRPIPDPQTRVITDKGSPRRTGAGSAATEA